MAFPTSTRETRPTPVNWRIWWPATVMMLGTVLAYLDRQILALLSPMILKETHLTAQAYTETISAFSYAYMVATLVWGPVLDRVGLRLGGPGRGDLRSVQAVAGPDRRGENLAGARRSGRRGESGGRRGRRRFSNRRIGRFNNRDCGADRHRVAFFH